MEKALLYCLQVLSEPWCIFNGRFVIVENHIMPLEKRRTDIPVSLIIRRDSAPASYFVDQSQSVHELYQKLYEQQGV